MFNKIRNALGLRLTESVHEYGFLFFDHLKSDYLLVESQITDTQDRETLTDILNKRQNRHLVWEDIRAFDMILLKYQSFETIRGKLLGLRRRFVGAINATELEEYKALPKVDLTAATPAQIEDIRAEYSDLSREFCLRYAFMASREGLRSLLLRGGAALTIIFCLLVIGTGFIIFQYDVSPYPTNNSLNDSINKSLNAAQKNLFAFATLLMVVFAGITGAFVSMQQRIQSVIYKGDPIMDLSGLTHGWLGIFLSPLSGAIFAVILYLFFAGKILTGSVFPTFVGKEESSVVDIAAKQKTVTVPATGSSPEANSQIIPQTSSIAANNQANTNTGVNTNKGNFNTNTAVNTNQGNVNVAANSNQSNTNQSTQPGNSVANANTTAIEVNVTPADNAEKKDVKQGVPIHLTEFLAVTGPAASKDLALLLIWCFIAGFAERFVPDALNRLVSKEGKTEVKA